MVTDFPNFAHLFQKILNIISYIKYMTRLYISLNNFWKNLFNNYELRSI